MLLKIQQTSTVSAKIKMKQHNNTCFSSCLWFLESNQEVPAGGGGGGEDGQAWN